MRRKRQTSQQKSRRRGAVSVEFAVVAPIFVTVALGIAQASRLLDIQNQLSVAAREGARLASMDRSGLLNEGQSTNDKIVQDIKNYLSASDLPADDIEVKIVSPEDHVTPLNLDDPINDLQLFELRVELPCSSVCSLASAADDLQLGATVVFRNSRAVLVQ